MSGWVRPEAVAGTFYPADPDLLVRTVAELMAGAGPTSDGGSVKAVIAPHAGYVYSGPVAATAYAALAPDRDVIRRVVLAGPAHFGFVDGVATSSADAFATPLGPVTIDAEARHAALSVSGVVVDDDAHADEHSVEVHLPLLHEVLGDVLVLPLVVGPRGGIVLSDVLDALWGGPETRIVISSDLSHYHDHATACAIDRDTAESICRLDPPDPDRACGAAPVHGMLLAARRHGLAARLLDLRTSADTAGEPSRVVGYGAFTLSLAA